MTTSLAYEELLAFEGLGNAVAQLYRAYLDAVLVRFKQASNDDSKKYWDRVREFRTSELDPGTRLKYPEKAETRPAVPDPAGIEHDRKEKADLIEFLYWFDVRARFWSSERSSGFSLQRFPLDSEIELLYAQALALEARLRLLTKVRDIELEGAQQTGPTHPGLSRTRRQVLDLAKASAIIELVRDASSQHLEKLHGKAQKAERRNQGRK